MARSRPTKEEQRILHNHFRRLVAEQEQISFTPLPENAPVTYEVPEIFADLAKLYGLKCQVPQCSGRSRNYILEHINGNDDDWSPGNLRIGCKSCNRLVVKYQMPRDRGNSSAVGRENAQATKSGNGRTTAAEHTQRHRLANSELTFAKSKDYKRRAYIYLMQWTANGQSVDEESAALDIAALTGCDEAIAQKYIRVFSQSRFSPLEPFIEGQRTRLKQRKGYDPLLHSCEEDQQAYRDAQQVIAQETAARLQEQADKAKDLQQELEAAMLHNQLIKQLGRYVSLEELTVKPLDYLQNPTKYKADGVNAPTCLKCGKRKPMLNGQLACDVCKADAFRASEGPQP